MTRRPLRLLLASLVAMPLAALAAPAAVAELRDGAGKVVGRATFEPAEGGVRIAVNVTGLRPGAHGIHVHDVGTCTAPDFKSAGGHFNPTGKKHGLESSAGAHAGDMPNLVVGPDGAGEASWLLRGATISPGDGSLFHPGGTAVVIHADPDDGKTDPSGNSGARIACGPITRG